MESQSLNIYLIFYSVIVAVCAFSAIGFFWARVSQFQKDLHAMATDLHESEQYKNLTQDAVQRLHDVFQRVPAMARCFQIFRQSLIPPQPPHTQYFRSSRDAMLTFDRTYILRNSLSLGFFQMIPGVLISLGVLGTIIAFAYCVKNAAPLFTQADIQSLSEIVEGLFLFGAKSFWPAGVAIVGGLASQLIFHIRAQKVDEDLQSLVTYIDTLITPTNIEQISSQSLVEMKLQNDTINTFTTQFYKQMTHVLDDLAKTYVAPVKNEIHQIGEQHLAPMHENLNSVAKNASRIEQAVLGLGVEFKNALTDLQSGLNEKFESLEATQVRIGEEASNRFHDAATLFAELQNDLNSGLGNAFQAMQNLEQAAVESDAHRRDEMNELIRAMNLSVDTLSETYQNSSELASKSIESAIKKAGSDLKQVVAQTEKMMHNEINESKKDMQYQVRKMQGQVEKTVQDSLGETRHQIRKELNYLEAEVAHISRTSAELETISKDVQAISKFLESVPLSQIEVVHVPRQLRSTYREEEDERQPRRRKGDNKAS